MKPNRAVVTGASSGIGEEFAKLLASRGVNLVIAARREDRLKMLQEKLIKTYGVSVEIVPIDLSEAGAATKLFELSTKNGPIDMLINNAGAGPYREFLQTPRDEHEKIMQLNMGTLTSLSHLFAHHMQTHGRPSWILNVASIAGFTPAPRFAVYCGTKFYVEEKEDESYLCVCEGAVEIQNLKSREIVKKDEDVHVTLGKPFKKSGANQMMKDMAREGFVEMGLLK